MNVSNNLITRFFVRNFIDTVYCVGYRFSNIWFWEQGQSKFRVLKPSLRYWYADPIPFKYKGNYYVFMEKYNRINDLGSIAVATIDHRGRLCKKRTVIETGTHLSFPMILEYRGQHYLMPETSATRSIEIYKMGDTPYQWEHYYSLGLDEEIVDIAFIEDEEDLLLVGGIVDPVNSHSVRRQIIRLIGLDHKEAINYKISYTDEKCSMKARNGGNFHSKGEKLYRITQESTDAIYGLALILNEVTEITEDTIKEIELRRKSIDDVNVNLIKCLYKKIGIHTYGTCENGFEVIDLAAAKLSIVPLIKKMRRG